VVFPLLSRYQDKPDYLVGACIKARRAVLWLSGAVCSGFALFAPLFFETLYDSRYTEAGDTSRWLAIYTWSHVLIASMDRIPLALGTPKKLFVANLLTVCGMAFAVLGYREAGLHGFILGMAGAKLLSHVYLVGGLPFHKWGMLSQSLRFTVGYLAYALSAVFALAWVEPRVHLYGYMAAVCLAAGLPILLASGRVWFIIKDRKKEAL